MKPFWEKKKLVIRLSQDFKSYQFSLPVTREHYYNLDLLISLGGTERRRRERKRNHRQKKDRKRQKIQMIAWYLCYILMEIYYIISTVRSATSELYSSFFFWHRLNNGLRKNEMNKVNCSCEKPLNFFEWFLVLK